VGPSSGHPFYQKLNEVLAEAGVEQVLKPLNRQVDVIEVEESIF
jgi:hypothetical protein